jgi:hypothetical protein
MIPVILYGLGPIGIRIGRRLAQRPGVELAGAIDIDPAKEGWPLADILAVDAPHLIVDADAERVLAAAEGPGVVVHATSSRLDLVVPQLAGIARAGWNAVSTCEQLVHPWLADAALADELDAVAADAGVTILGSGINPGFLLDSFVLMLTAACARVDAVRVERIVDTDQRREPLQRKAGVGMTEGEFRALAERGAIGHVGLSQSAHLVADGLGFQVTDYRETIEPVLATRATATGLGTVAAGDVLGQHQTATLLDGDRPVVSFTQVMAAGRTPVDVIEIDGEPPIRQRIEGGVNGDIGTEAVIANLVRPVLEARPGLRTMRDIMPLACAAAA